MRGLELGVGVGRALMECPWFALIHQIASVSASAEEAEEGAEAAEGGSERRV